MNIEKQSNSRNYSLKYSSQINKNTPKSLREEAVYFFLIFFQKLEKNKPNWFGSNNLLSILIVVFCLFTEGGILNAQQDGSMTLFTSNPLIFNPAAAGASPYLAIHHRTQWLGFKGAPQQQVISYSGTPFSKRLGVGLTLQNRRIGIFENQTSVLALSYSPIKTEKWSMRIGLQGSARRYGLRFNDLAESDAFFRDNSVARDFQTLWTANMGMGFHVNYEEAYFGIGIPFFVPNLLGINRISPTTAIESRHIYAMGGLTLPITEGVKLKPNALFKQAQNAPWNLETNVNLAVKEVVFIGVGYRVGKTNASQLGESVDFLLNVKIAEKMSLGVAYDLLLSQIGLYSRGSFEAVLRYDFKKKDIQLSNPRGSNY